jgi:Flp pilus assembly protein TadG
MKPFLRQRGVALVELAISLLLLLTIAFGITEFGRAIYEYNTLAKAARDAVRYLSVRAPGDATAATSAKCLVVHGNTACTGPALAPALTTAIVTVCDSISCPADHALQGAAPVLNLVSVTIGGPNAPYTFNSMFSFFVPDFAFGPISVTMKQVL